MKKNYEKAKLMYLQGYKSSEIKSKTGVSTVSLLRYFSSLGLNLSVEDVRNYQIKYISEHYTKADIENAYKYISENYDDIFASSRKKEIKALDCVFGCYKKVFFKYFG